MNNFDKTQLTLQMLEKFDRAIALGGKHVATEYLYSGLGTHNRDGTLTKEYGGQRTDDDHPVHSKKVEPPAAKISNPIFTVEIELELVQDLKAISHLNWKDELAKVLGTELVVQYEEWERNNP
jgi:hypothetical protein